jgi:hypothetical protein
MKFLYKIPLVVIVLVSVLLVLALNNNEKAPSSTDNSVTNRQWHRADLSKLKKEIDRKIGNPRAGRLKQSRVIALGAKACGGPKTYLVYSSLQTNENQLKRLINQ